MVTGQTNNKIIKWGGYSNMSTFYFSVYIYFIILGKYILNSLWFSHEAHVLQVEQLLPAEWDSGLGRGCVDRAARQRCSLQTRYQWSWNNGGSPWGSQELGSTVSPLPESCAVPRLTPPLGPGQNHRSGRQVFMCYVLFLTLAATFSQITLANSP